MSKELKPCPRCGAKNSHAIFLHTEKVTANGRTNYVRFVGIRCDDCGFSLDGYLNTDEAVTMWNTVNSTSPLLDKVIPIEANMPHKASEVICVKCGKRWISVRPKDTLLKDIVCPNCGCGYVIETGEEMREVTE